MLSLTRFASEVADASQHGFSGGLDAALTPSRSCSSPFRQRQSRNRRGSAPRAISARTFTGPLARSLALVAIVIGGLMFMFGEAGAKRQISGIVFGGGLALFAAQFLTWLF